MSRTQMTNTMNIKQSEVVKITSRLSRLTMISLLIGTAMIAASVLAIGNSLGIH
ncbi:hypothetical protein [Dongshaea marina]|uniref:hypothetical protein n=1 Tax=Dongshaea marina TaxID=2047966 RepID=UPI00131F37D6|nr:hypothetical protein [Dongshaea marina]